MREEPGEPALLYIDLHLVHEVTSPQAFEGLRLAGRGCAGPTCTLATVDHNVPTTPAAASPTRSAERRSRRSSATARSSGSPLYSLGSRRPGDRPRDRPGARPHAAGDDDRLRRQPHLDARRVRRARVRHRHHRGRARARDPDAAAAQPEDDARRASRAIGRRRHRQGPDPRRRSARSASTAASATSSSTPGAAIRALSMEGRMTICNMSIEGGAPRGHDRARRDDVRLPRGPPARAAGRRLGRARSSAGAALPTDDGATFDREIVVDVAALVPQVTWGTNPGMVAPVDGVVPDPRARRRRRPRAAERALAVHGRSSRARRSRRSRSTGSSSARARTRASRTCAPPPTVVRGPQGRRPRAARWSSPARRR